MLNAPLALDLAHSVMRERLREAKREALLHEALAAQPGLPSLGLLGAARRGVASGLRRLAVQLDPTLDCRPAMAVLSSSSR